MTPESLPAHVSRAIGAASATASELGLRVEDAAVIQNSARVVVRLIPCDVVARVSPLDLLPWASDDFDVRVACRLAEVGSPVGEPEPRAERRVYLRDGFAITLWRYYPPAVATGDRQRTHQLGFPSDIAPVDYARALIRLHAGLRQMELAAPHISVRVTGWAEMVNDGHRTPGLSGPDRELLRGTLRRVRTWMSGWDAVEQPLHGEPHPGNVLSTTRGPLFIDFETCQRGPVEYDIAYAPEEVAEHYPGADPDLVHQCRILMWAGITATRWGREDQFPNRDHWRVEGLKQLRAALGCYGGTV